MGRRFRRHDAFELAATEVGAVLGEALGQAVAHEGRRRGAARGDTHPAADDGAADRGHPELRQPFPSLQHDARIDLGDLALERQAFLHRQQDLADAEQADDGDEEVEAAQQLVPAEGHAQLPRRRVLSDGGQAKPNIIDAIVFMGGSLPMPTKLQKVNSWTEKSSAGPNASAKSATIGARKVRMMTATKAPKKDEVKAAVRASPARPCCASG